MLKCNYERANQKRRLRFVCKRQFRLIKRRFYYTIVFNHDIKRRDYGDVYLHRKEEQMMAGQNLILAIAAILFAYVCYKAYKQSKGRAQH